MPREGRSREGGLDPPPKFNFNELPFVVPLVYITFAKDSSEEQKEEGEDNPVLSPALLSPVLLSKLLLVKLTLPCLQFPLRSASLAWCSPVAEGPEATMSDPGEASDQSFITCDREQGSAPAGRGNALSADHLTGASSAWRISA